MKADTITKAYVQDASIFADIFNYYVYQGRQVIEPEQLKERDSTKIALPYGADGAVVPVQKFRDVQNFFLKYIADNGCFSLAFVGSIIRKIQPFFK